MPEVRETAYRFRHGARALVRSPGRQVPTFHTGPREANAGLGLALTCKFENVTTIDLDRRRVERAKVAVAVTFATNGLALGGWLARAPTVRDALHLSAAGF